MLCYPLLVSFLGIYNLGYYSLHFKILVIMSQTMPFTDQAVVETCTKFIDSLEQPACNCNAGVRMCKHTPCIGTVDDIEKLINAGYAKNLMLDWWVGEDSGVRKMNKIFNKGEPEEPETPQLFKRKLKPPEKRLHRENPFTEDVSYLVPAVVGYGGKKAAFVKTGACNLLIDNKCSVHDLNLKPVQGRMACCKINRVFVDENGKQQNLDERVPILHTWNTQRGKDLIERWKKEVGYDEDGDEAPIPETTGDLISALLSILGSHAEMYEPNTDGTPIHDDRPVKTVTYEKPY
jgi:hypothetical protein